MLVCSTCKQVLPDHHFNKDNRPSRKSRGYQTFCRDCQRESKWLYRYNLTAEGYSDLLAQQNGRCAICKQTHDQIKSHKTNRHVFCVDHDHATGKVRSLLCSPCNVFIAMAKESKERLEEAIRYLHG